MSMVLSYQRARLTSSLKAAIEPGRADYV